MNDEDYLYEDDVTGRSSPRRGSPLRGGDRYDSPDRTFGRYVISDVFSTLLNDVCKKKNIVSYYFSLLVRTFIFLVVNKKISFQDGMSGLFE